MSNWMRRRIERSRARCGKVSAARRPDKSQAAEKQTQPADIAPLEPTVKDD
ncbi:MAG: hypothetical protein ABW250_14995 [Pyrinomonadaceae bacterium]